MVFGGVLIWVTSSAIERIERPAATYCWWSQSASLEPSGSTSTIGPWVLDAVAAHLAPNGCTINTSGASDRRHRLTTGERAA